jgi:hypothetical protein
MNLCFKHSERGTKLLAPVALAIGTLGQAKADIIVPGSSFEVFLGTGPIGFTGAPLRTSPWMAERRIPHLIAYSVSTPKELLPCVAE